MRINYSTYKETALNFKKNVVDNILTVLITRAILTAFIPITLITYIVMHIIAIFILSHFKYDMLGVMIKFNKSYSITVILVCIIYFIMTITLENKFRNKVKRYKTQEALDFIANDFQVKLDNYKKSVVSNLFVYGFYNILYIIIFG